MQQYITLAAHVAQQSEYPVYRHGAVLVQGARVVNASCNRYPPQSMPGTRKPASHAELLTLLHMSRADTEGATLYVVRCNRAGLLRFSKPCDTCMDIIRHARVRTVVYSTQEGDTLCLRVS